MRIISGKLKGRKLVEAKNCDFRPTTDRNREALFNILESNKLLSEKGFNLQGANMLDLCCGSGAVGFEAISRGVKKCIFVDNNKKHLKIVQDNAKNFALSNEVQVIYGDAYRLDKILKGYKFDFIFMDPPYDNNYENIFRVLGALDIFTKNCLIVVEFNKKMKLEFLDEELFEVVFVKEYGNSCFAFILT